MKEKNKDDIDHELIETFEEVVVEIFEVLNSFGIEELHIGGLMRILGVSREIAEQFDNKIVTVEQFDNPTPESDVHLDELTNSLLSIYPSRKLH